MILLKKIYKFFVSYFSSPSVSLVKTGNVFIGHSCKIQNCKLIGISEITIGHGTTIMENVEVNARINKIVIGNYCSIAKNTLIIEYSHHLNRLSTYFISKNFFKGNMNFDVFSKGNIIIKNDVWIGANVVVLSGVTIGNGAVIGANSVVKHSVPDYAIVSGNPARILKYRFEKDFIHELLEIEWWNLIPAKLYLLRPFLDKELSHDSLSQIKSIIQNNNLIN